MMDYMLEYVWIVGDPAGGAYKSSKLYHAGEFGTSGS